ncbi:facilitated trehalose transporter Tret1-like [Contarinia nasturtii]|uniref:facilitated trehalose transporter Tret1-like n=1 Tax=Contarinia nasturtii TaxID=265458 RepID=UPI0012D3C928|nr:facilitated trehalose transporter Tret1-like [Contarinia nasturtii]XP_031630518.1 facilitated trehalose transporter Tret1-like [Contarinia nasturtii]
MGSALYQYLCCICVNLCTVGYGISVGWMASAVVVYDSDASPLPTGRVKMDEIGWIVSILGIGGLIGTVAVGWLSERVGRKSALIAMAVPQIISYLLIIYAQNVYYLYASRFLSGFVGGAVFVVIPIMVAEIAEDRIRGTLCTILVLGSTGGVLLGFVAGHFLDYSETPRISLMFPILFIAFFSFMPETPYYLMKTNRMEEAEKSLRFYRNISPKAAVSDNKTFEHELSKLKYSYTETQRKDTECSSSSPLKLSDFFNRPFAIGCTLMVAHETCGGFTMCAYAAMIFSKSGSTMSPGISAIIVGAIQFLGSYVSALLIDRLGRKVLMVFSFTGTGISHVVLATYIYLASSTNINLQAFQWVPVASFSAMIFIASCGALPIPYVIVSEILPDKIRSIGTTFIFCISWALTFVLVKIFPPLFATIGLHSCIFMFAISCFATVVYLLLFVPETKGKSLDEILIILKAK